MCLVLVCQAFGGAACRSEKSAARAQDALATFRLPDAFHIEVAAAEPEVQNPVAMAFDARGRLFVVELSDYPLGAPRARTNLSARGARRDPANAWSIQRRNS
jgi:hypothetical protein